MELESTREDSMEGVDELSSSRHSGKNNSSASSSASTVETASLETESIDEDDEDEATAETSHASHPGRTRAGGKDKKVNNNDDDKPRVLYLGLTGWKELEEGRPLALCTLRKAPPRVSKNSGKSTEQEKKKRPSVKAARTRIHRSLPTAARKKSRGSTAANRNKKSNSVVTNHNHTKSASRAVNSSNSSKDPEKTPKKRAFRPKLTFSALAREKAKRAIHNPDKEFTITETTPDDVLLGRGNNLVTFSGNIKFRETVLKYRAEYLASKRVEKGIIAQRIADDVWSRGGRFLEFDGSSKWRETNMTRILEKTTQALREKHAWKEHHVE